MSVCYPGLCSYRVYIKARAGGGWEERRVAVPPVARHHVEKVRTSSERLKLLAMYMFTMFWQDFDLTSQILGNVLAFT